MGLYPPNLSLASCNTLLKYNMDGDMIWNRTWGGSHVDIAQSLYVINDNIYVTGGTENYYDSDAFILKYNTNGDLIWNRTWDNNERDWALSIQCNGDSIYVTGNTGIYETSINDVFLLKYNIEGDLIWNRTWGSERTDLGSSLYINSGYIYIAGLTQNVNPSEYHDVLLLKYDSEGDLQWNITWDNRDYSSARTIFIYNGYIYLAGSISTREVPMDALLLKLDLNGKIIKSWYWGEDKGEYVNSIFVKKEAIFIVGAASPGSFLLKCKV